MPRLITVTLNPTVDRILETPGLRLGDHASVQLRSRRPAGKGINVSRALAVLGVPSIAFGFAGSDTRAWFEAELTAAGVTPRLIPLNRPTRENITLIDSRAGNETHLREQGPMVEPSDLATLRDALAGLADAESVIVFTGSCAPGIDAAAFGGLIDLVLARGARAVVDSSGEPLKEAARRRLWLLKINEAELTELVGTPLGDELTLARAMGNLRETIHHVVVTRGQRGALAMGGDKLLRGRAAVPAGRLGSTVGCGDAFLAGYLAAGAEGSAPDEALRMALAVAAASAMSVLPADFDAAEARLLRDQAVIETVPAPQSPG